MPKQKRIGFRYSAGDFETVPLEVINNEEDEAEDQDDSTVLLSDFIPGAVYDGTGNILTQDSFKAQTKKTKAEARNLNIGALSKLILYSSLAASFLLLSYGAYNKYLKTPTKQKTEILNQPQR
jgi:hypothetical protein